MITKLIKLQDKLESDQKRLEEEIKALSQQLHESVSSQFSEHAAASKITAAKTQDYLQGTDTAKQIINDVEKARNQHIQALEKFEKRKKERQRQLLSKQAELEATKREFNLVSHKIQTFVAEEAESILQDTVNDYQSITKKLIQVLTEIDALKAIILNNPESNPVRYVLQIESLPATDLTPESIQEPLQIISGGKIILPREKAFSAVHNRISALNEEIKGKLHDK